jgi:hypothetical protein
LITFSQAKLLALRPSVVADAVGRRYRAAQVKATMAWFRRIAVILLIAGIPAADAAPLVPPGDQPGRERERFTPSPLDRFMQPNPRVKPLLRWDCDQRRAWRSTQRYRRNRDC